VNGERFPLRNATETLRRFWQDRQRVAGKSPHLQAPGSPQSNKSKKGKPFKIFISYRRDDAGGWAGRLYDKLVQQFGEDHIFMDIDTISPGVDFVEAIQQAVTSCDVLLALIGQTWLTATDASNSRRRIDIPTDYVRVEIAAALKRNILVIPVLLPKASMPRMKDLPQVLRSLSRRQAFDLSETRFHHDVYRLLSSLKT
jgi:hypothetical protein